MIKYEDYNENTVISQNTILGTNILKEDYDILKDLKYAFDLDRRNAVFDGVVERIHILDPKIGEDYTKIIAFLNEQYINMGISSGVPKTVKDNWLKEGKINTDSERYRYNLYDLCLALKMNWKETSEFFVKNYMTIPVVYKCRTDMIYYYGIKNNKSYTEIKDILNKTEGKDQLKEEPSSSSSLVKSKLDSIKDDTELIEYVIRNSYSKEMRNLSARKKIDVLLDECDKQAEKQSALEKELDPLYEKPKYPKKTIVEDYNSDDTNKKKAELSSDPKINRILHCIYGFDPQTVEIPKGKLPTRFAKNLPLNQQFSQIKKGEASSDTLRKALILLEFYFFYGSIRNRSMLKALCKSTEEIAEDFFTFESETNDLLNECGFEGLYPRNPFDYIIEYCAYKSTPLEVFQGLFEEE